MPGRPYRSLRSGRAAPGGYKRREAGRAAAVVRSGAASTVRRRAARCVGVDRTRRGPAQHRTGLVHHTEHTRTPCGDSSPVSETVGYTSAEHLRPAAKTKICTLKILTN